MRHAISAQLQNIHIFALILVSINKPCGLGLKMGIG